MCFCVLVGLLHCSFSFGALERSDVLSEVS